MIACSRLAAVAVCAVVVSWGNSASAAGPTPAQINFARTAGLAWLFKTQQGDGGWSANSALQVQATSAVLDAFQNAGIKTGTVFYAGVANLANAQPSSSDGRARQAASLNRAGVNVSAFAAQLQKQATQYGISATYSIPYAGWGTLKGYSTNVADTALAMAAMMDVSSSYTDYSNVVCNVFGPEQRAVTGTPEFGGWPYQTSSKTTNSFGNVTAPRIVPTAYAILVLQKVLARTQSVRCNGPAWGIADLMTKGTVFLKTKQNTDGGFGENGSGTSGALETALAYQAIKAATPSDTTTLDAALNYLITTQNATTGAWGNDPFQTALVLQVLPSVVLLSTANDGIPDVVKTKINPSANLNTPSTGYMPGNGQSVAGVTRPLIAAGAILGQPFNYTYTGSGTSPFNFALASGALPDGLALSSTGVVSGTPTSAGSFSFALSQVDSLGGTYYIDGLISVSVAASATTTTVTAGANPAFRTQPTLLIATVVGRRPHGSVTFYDGATQLGSVTLYDSDASVTNTQSTFNLTVPLAGGFRKITATYSGDALNLTSTSPVMVEMVNPTAAAILSASIQ